MSAPVAQPEQREPTSEQALLGALAVVLLADADPQVTAAHALPLLAELGIAPAEGMAALALVLPHPLPDTAGVSVGAGQDRPGPAQAWNAGTAITRRVEYVANAAKRLKDPAHSADRERAYLASHLRAQQARASAAARVDRAVRIHGQTLGWYAVMDSRTTRECRAANGANFSAVKPPVIGYPGALHGGTCRCFAGKAHDTVLTVDEALAPIFQNAVIPFPADFSRSALDLAFDPDQPRDRAGRWRRVIGWLTGGDRSKLGGHGNPPEHPRAPQGSRARDEAARVVGFPDVADAVEAQRLGAELVGQRPQPLERRQALESALARPRNYVAYGGDLADAAASIAHGVSQAQAFGDGNKRTALALVFHFLLENGRRLTRAEIDELADHVGGYGEGTHTLEGTAAWLRSVLSPAHPWK